MNEPNEPNETIELAGPVSDHWYRTQIPDWIALNPDLKDGAFRLYCILRALILEKQKNRIRVLSHEQIAFLAVGKNGKPASISTVKALLANLQEVGLVANPDGSRIVTSSGPGTIQSRRRYQLADWPKDRAAYEGWMNAFDKLDAFTDDWRETRTDVCRGRLEGQKSDLDSQKSDEDGQKTDVDGQKSGENPAPTSDDAPSLKELPEVGALSSSSSADAHAEPPQGETPERKTKKPSPEQIIIDKLSADGAQPQGGPPTPDEATAIKRLVISQAAADGVRVHTPAGYLSGRDVVLLEQDLAAVRGLQVPAQASTGGSYWENQMRGERNARNGHRGGTRYGVESQETYEALAAMSDQEAIDHMFFDGKPAQPLEPAGADADFSGDF